VFDESEGGKHYVTVFMACRVDGAVQPKVSKVLNFSAFLRTSFD